MKKKPGDIIILQICTINDNYMIYGSRDMERNRQEDFLSFWTVFCPFTPPPLWTQNFNAIFTSLLSVLIDLSKYNKFVSSTSLTVIFN